MRFVVHHHTGWPQRPDHYDLMLQVAPGADDDDTVLRVFATLANNFPDGKSHADVRARGEGAGNPIDQTNLLRLIADHRRAYLTYEGDVRDGRGSVARVEEGALAWLRPADEDFGELRFTCEGKRLKGDYRLRHMGGGTYVFERFRRV